MTDQEAMETAIRRTGVERYRWLCSDANPHPEPNSAADYRRLMHRLAAPPSLSNRAVNLARALRRWAAARFAMASGQERARRLSICVACPEWDGGRCRLCGCSAAKLRLKTEHCPINKW